MYCTVLLYIVSTKSLLGTMSVYLGNTLYTVCTEALPPPGPLPHTLWSGWRSHILASVRISWGWIYPNSQLGLGRIVTLACPCCPSTDSWNNEESYIIGEISLWTTWGEEKKMKHNIKSWSLNTTSLCRRSVNGGHGWLLTDSQALPGTR